MGKRQVIFKKHSQNQGLLLPKHIGDLIPQKHIVRLVDRVIDELDISSMMELYAGGGTSSYHPRMMLKVLVYGYLDGVYSCRKIAKALRENIYFMWISGDSQPSFKTINNFRGGRLKGHIEKIFESLVDFCVAEEYIDLKELYVDGTKMQSNANKYTAVWRKNTERYTKRVKDTVQEILKEVDRINSEDDKQYGDKDLPEMGEHINATKLQEKIKDLSEKINQQTDKDKKKELSKKRTILNREQKKLVKYEGQESVLDGRNSYSKTDTDATFMRWKDGRLLPSYNIQASSQDQFIVHYTIGRNAADQYEFEHHLESLPPAFIPTAIVGDSGYGSEINYELLEKNNIESYLKYGSFHKELKGEIKKKKFHKDNFPYNPDTDSFTCPNNRSLVFKAISTRTLRNGKKIEKRVYECPSCQGCPFKSQCIKNPETAQRSIYFNPQWEKYKQDAKANLTSQQGLIYRSKRSIDIETVFGNIKTNKKFDRFTLRGLQKVTIEFGLVAMAHNLAKMAAKLAQLLCMLPLCLVRPLYHDLLIIKKCTSSKITFV